MRRWPTLAAAVAVVIIVTSAGFLNQAAHAETTVPGSTNVSLNVAEAIEVTWPEQEIVLDSAAIPQVAIIYGPLTITVHCNTIWGVRIASDNLSGKMQQFSTQTGSYIDGGFLLANPVEWGTTFSGPWIDLTSSPVAAYSTMPSTGDSGSSVDLYLRVIPSYDDKVLSAGEDYRIVVNYTAGVGY